MTERKSRLVSLAEIACDWSCSKSTVRRALARAHIEPFRIGTSENATLRYERREVEQYLARCRGIVPDLNQDGIGGAPSGSDGAPRPAFKRLREEGATR